LRDQKIRLLYDNRRIIKEPKGIPGYDMSGQLFDSKPFTNVIECSQQRFQSKFAFTIPYLKSTPVRRNTRTSYKNYLEIGVRNLIKGYFAIEPCFGFKGTEFKRYNDIISFIFGFDQSKDIQISKQSISNLKNRQIIIRPVPKTRENIEFATYIKSKFPHFDVSSFLK